MTPDDDLDLDTLRATARAATPRPDPDTRAAHLRLAQENFDKMQAAAQGPAPDPRLIPDSPGQGIWRGVRNMLNTLTGRGALTLTTALVACGLVVLTPFGQGLLRDGNPLRGEDVTTAVPPPPADLADGLPEAPGLAAETVEPPVVVVEPTLRAVPEAAPGAAAVEAESDSGIALGGEAQETAPAPGLVDGLVAPADDMALGRLAAEAPMAEALPAPVIMPDAMIAPPEADTEAFATAADNPLRVVADTPVSTFSIDVDTASYAIVRQSLNAGQLPPPDAVRVEEMVNYFPYAYPLPEGDAPFRSTVTVIDTPWNAGTELVHIAIQGRMPAIADRPPLNLVFLIDTSGSMEDATKLPLLKQSFLLMLDTLRPEDQVAIVAYAGSSGLVLPPTAAADRQAILTAMQNLAAGGGTNGQGGLEQAYAVAQGMMAEGEVARVILATDGDFNLGLSGTTELTDYIAEKRETGVFLSVLGFGRGNLDDATMQALAQNGNGTAAYIDTLNEAQKVLVDQLTGALFTIASDVKVQVEFNPAVIAEYRLIGYETRALNREDFNNDAVDAGEIGAGLSVTAIYEVTPVGSPAVMTTPLRYGDETASAPQGNEIGFLRLRWKAPGDEVSALQETPILTDAPPPDAALRTEVDFAVAMAGFGQLLRDTPFLGQWGWDEAIALAAASRGDDPFGYRIEAVRLMRLAASLSE